MRIIYILTSLGIGGAEKQVTAISERFIGKGHSVAFLVLKHSEVECPTSASVIRLNLKKTARSITGGLKSAADFLSVYRPDIIHSHTFPANIFARFLKSRLHKNHLHPPLVNTIHNVYEGGRLRMLAYRLTDRKTDAVVAVSAAAAVRFVRLRAVSSSRLSVITNGIDTDQYQNRSELPPFSNPMESDPVENTFVWLAVGRIAPAKDYPNLLRAFASVLRQSPKVSLWIAGEGDPSYLQQNLSEIETSLLSLGRVRWLGLRHDIADLMNSADAFVLTSSWEGMPLVVGEAMACERAVVATDVGGVRELVGESGIIVPPANSQALAAAMLQVMKMSRLQRESLGAGARQRIVAGFSLDSKVDRIERLYRSLLPAGIL